MNKIEDNVTSKKIVEISSKYFKGVPTKRDPELIQTLGDIELETKMNIKKLSDVRTILDKIKKVGFSSAIHRTEYHHFFSKDLIAHSVLILIKDSNEVWIKIKKDKQQINTPFNNFPILSRHEKKLKPQDPSYLNEFQQTIVSNYIGSFKKECLDFFFYYKNLSFVITLSLADSKHSSLYQIEFEFAGHKKTKSHPV
jgi:hypothetical protein